MPRQIHTGACTTLACHNALNRITYSRILAPELYPLAGQNERGLIIAIVANEACLKCNARALNPLVGRAFHRLSG